MTHSEKLLGVSPSRHFRKVSRSRMSKPGLRQPTMIFLVSPAHGGIDRAVPAFLARRALMTDSALIAAAGATATARCASSGAQLSWAEKIGCPPRSLRARIIRRVAPVRRFRNTRPQSELAV